MGLSTITAGKQVCNYEIALSMINRSAVTRQRVKHSYKNKVYIIRENTERTKTRQIRRRNRNDA